MSSLNPGSGDPAKVYHYHRLGPRLNLINSLRHSVHPSPKFCRGQKVQNFGSILTPVAFDALWFQNGATCRKSNSCSLSENDWTSFWLRHFADSSPNFYTGVNYLEIWPNVIPAYGPHICRHRKANNTILNDASPPPILKKLRHANFHGLR